MAVRRRRIHVGFETKPVEIVEHVSLELRARSLSIVIFDAQQDAAVAIVRSAPHIHRIDDVSEVKMTGGCGREACQHVPLRIACQPLKAPFRPPGIRCASSGTSRVYPCARYSFARILASSTAGWSKGSTPMA